MKYSVIIPAYNCKTTLAKTVNSIRTCGLTDYEIILVDDGSTDGSSALCDRLAAEYPQVRCFHQENQGVSAARNHGLDEACGDYVWFFDSDDLVDPGSMTRAAQIVEKHQPDMLIFGMSFDFYKGRRMYQRLELFYDVEGLMSPEDVNNSFSELYRNNALTSSCNKLFRQSILTGNHLSYNPALFIMEDFLFVLQALSHCQSVYNLPQVVYRYVQDSGDNADHAAKRLERISDLVAYLKPFEKELSGHEDILTGLFFMLLRQKLSIQKPAEIELTAKENCDNKYTTGELSIYAGEADIVLIHDLQNGKWKAIAGRQRKTHIRQALVGMIKKSLTYSLLKGSKPRRVKW